MADSNGLDILVIGTGMYVCGRYTDGYGTVLPAIYEWSKRNTINEIHIAGTNPDSIDTLQHKQAEIEQLFQRELPTSYYPEKTVDDKAYLTALEELSDPCCAVVVVPDHLHEPITADVIKHGVSPLVVKPLTSTVEAADRLISLQNEHDVHAAVEFHKRFDRSNQLLRDAYQAGEYGDPLYFLVQYSQRKSVPETHFESWVDTTNIFQYLGPHYVDIIRFVTGATPTRVSVSGQKEYFSSKGIDTYDAIEVMVEWKRETGATFQSCFLTNWIDPEETSAMSDQRIKLIGTEGRHEADQKRRGIKQVTDNEGITEPNPDFCTSYGTPETQSFRYEGYGIDSFTRFFTDVVRFTDPSSTVTNSDDRIVGFRESKVSTAVVEAVNTCLENNQLSMSVDINSR